MSAKFCFLFFSFSCVSKVAFFIFLQIIDSDLLFGGAQDGNYNDADYYDQYARDVGNRVAVNIWPILLRFLNYFGLYSREGVIVGLILIGGFAIPMLAGKVSIVRRSALQKKVFWFVVVYASLYPTLFYYSLDIYRDVFMVFIFLVGLAAVKSYIENIGTYTGALKIVLIFAAACLMFELRIYLGLAFILAFLSLRLFSFRRVPLIVYVLCYLVGINVLYALGFFEPLLEYRAGFLERIEVTGSTLGIQFGSAMFFLPDFILSFCYQMLGLFFPNSGSVFLFVMESIPFLFLLSFVIRNRRYSGPFVDFIVLFFVFYGTVWVIGNGNLGTAVRLRLFNYLAVLIAASIIYQRKHYHRLQVRDAT